MALAGAAVLGLLAVFAGPGSAQAAPPADAPADTFRIELAPDGVR